MTTAGICTALRARPSTAVTPATLGVAGRFVLLAAIWGSSFTLIKTALGGLSPARITLIRLMLGAGVLVAVGRIRGAALPRGRRTAGHLVIAAALGNVLPFLLLSYGERDTGAGIAGVVIGGTPLLTVAMAAALRQETMTGSRLLALLVGFAGVVVLIAPWRYGSGLAGELACLGAAASYAAGFVYVRRFLSGTATGALGMAAGQLLAAVGLQAAVSPLLGWPGIRPSLTVLTSIVLLAVVGTGLAYVLYFRLIADLGATTAATVDYLVPVFAVLFGVVLLGEPLTWHLVVGGLTVVAAVGYDESRRRTAGR